jgi:hypothetical protein
MHTETLVAMLEEWEEGDETRTQDSGEAALREMCARFGTHYGETLEAFRNEIDTLELDDMHAAHCSRLETAVYDYATENPRHWFAEYPTDRNRCPQCDASIPGMAFECGGEPVCLLCATGTLSHTFAHMPEVFGDEGDACDWVTNLILKRGDDVSEFNRIIVEARL